MSFFRHSDGHYRSSLLDSLDWLDHVFGTVASGPPPACLTLRQIHSDRVLAPSECQSDSEGDALLAVEPGVWVGVKTADCAPILLADSEHRVAAAVHAGWRGTAAGIAAAAVRRLEADFGARPAHIFAAIGPAIGPCCYEVGPEVASRFTHLFPERDDLSRRTRLDLAEANRRLLSQTGIPPLQIETANLCTACHPAEFHSWRRDHHPHARMISGVCLR